VGFMGVFDMIKKVRIVSSEARSNRLSSHLSHPFVIFARPSTVM
jgi:hypothetical protein